MNRSNTEIFTAFDLELDQPENKIISIGYCIGNIYTEEVLERGDIYVKRYKPLNEEIVKLTGITDELLEKKGFGSTLEAYKVLSEAHMHHNSFINPITWGGGDFEALKSECDAEAIEYSWVFGRRFIDSKTVYITRQLARKQHFKGGLASSMKKVGLNFEGRKHKSEDDAFNTFRMYCRLLKD